MSDPRLNSVHLDPPRREDYRRARARLLNARGTQTIALECDEEDERAPGHPHTIIQNAAAGIRPPAGLKFWLADRDVIYPLKIGLNTVGRAPDNDVVISDSYVSRRHCVILVHSGDNCELHDTASKNGTYVNGSRLSGPIRLKPGDEIRMCDRQLVFLGKTDAPEHPGSAATQTS